MKAFASPNGFLRFNRSAQWIHKPWVAPKEELGVCLGRDYPEPMIDPAEARKTALLYYKMIGK